MTKADYRRSVFLNCPFDPQYAPLFDAMVFSVMDCGFHVRCSKENLDAGSVRIHNIYILIAGSRLAIHDLSRTELDVATNLPRFNMPLELGIFLGAKHLGDDQQRLKECLILDKDRYRYQVYVSDVAGQDISMHGNDPRRLIFTIRDWLAGMTDETLPDGAILWDRYQRFKTELAETCRRNRQRPERLTYREYVRYVDEFRPSKDDSLIVGDRTKIINPTPREIRIALGELQGDEDSFAIFAKSGSGLTYMQTAGAPEGGFMLEHQAGSLDAHYACASAPLSFDEIAQAFSWYASGDDRWRTGYEWQLEEI